MPLVGTCPSCDTSS